MALVSLAGVVLYLIGIPSLFFYKLFSNRAYTIFTKSLSMLSEQVETGEKRPEKAVQRMLELADQFSRKLGKKKLRCAVCDQLNEDTARACAHCGAPRDELRDDEPRGALARVRAGRGKEADFLRKHTGTLKSLLLQAHKQFLLTNQSENAPKYAAMKRELVEDVNSIVEQLDARVHLRSRYGFLLARWRPTAFYWELVPRTPPPPSPHGRTAAATAPVVWGSSTMIAAGPTRPKEPCGVDAPTPRHPAPPGCR